MSHPGVVSTSVYDSISFNVGGVGEMNSEARALFESYVRTYAVDLIQETSRNEVAHRSDTSNVPQYTSANVFDANRVIRARGVIPPKTSRWYYVARAIHWPLTVVVGVAGSTFFAPTPLIGYVATFAVTGTLGLILAFALEFKKLWESRR
jgi:hypothetical protein